MSKPRPHTVDEMRAMVLAHIRTMVDYWARVDGVADTRSRLDGLAFSILTMLDGGSELPAFDLTPAPHATDELFHRNRGENWWPHDEIINECQLHELWYAKPEG